MAFQIGCAQFSPVKADVDRNLDTIAAILVQAAEEGIDLLVLPETCTTGYFLEGGVLEGSLTLEDLAHRLSRRVPALPRDVDIALGFYERRDGHVYNSAAYLEAGPSGVSPRLSYQKFFLPTYGLFDEERFVARGRELAVFPTRLGTVALLICEDVWHSILPTLCAARGAQILLVPSASPARGFTPDGIGNHQRYRRLLTAISEEHGVFCANAQLCGFEGGKGFIGGSMVTDPFGRFLAEAPLAEPALIRAEVDLELAGIARAQTPLLADLQSSWQDIRRFVNETES